MLTLAAGGDGLVGLMAFFSLLFGGFVTTVACAIIDFMLDTPSYADGGGRARIPEATLRTVRNRGTVTLTCDLKPLEA